MLLSLWACVTGFLADFFLGDPAWLYHPVRLIGSAVSLTEKFFRKIAGTSKKELLVAAGALLWLIVAAGSFAIPFLLLLWVKNFYPAAGFFLETFWCFQIYAARSLVKESGRVYDRVRANDLPGARAAVSRIVGRDTENLSLEGVTKAAVETVAENTSDGVTAPMLYMLIGGAPLGFFYKAVNTMDSMLGYKNENYLYFGKIPAKMDDLFNYIPARLTGLFMVPAAFLSGLDAKGAWNIWRRDKRKHASPNSAQTEAACAGALGVRLAGDAVYFGKVYKKDFIGDALRPAEAEDIRKAGKLMYLTSALMLAVFGGIRLAAGLLL